MHTKSLKFLSDVPNEKSFFVENGKIRNLRELRDSLQEKGESFFKQYVNVDNHFANWIHEIVGDHELAHALRNSPNHAKTLELVSKRINYLELYLKFNNKKESLNNHFASQGFGLEFSPSYHTYENLDQYHQSLKKETVLEKVFRFLGFDV